MDADLAAKSPTDPITGALKDTSSMAQGDVAAMDSVKSAGAPAAVDAIDWEKVGKIYKPESAIEDILKKEMSRLQTALDQKIDF